MRISILALILAIVCSCQPTKEQSSTPETSVTAKVLDIQGHRGARGLMPENTIPAFLTALNYSKVTTLELDLAVTKDEQLVVSHEPWFNHVICFNPEGGIIGEEDKISIYQLTYEEVRQYDCGSKGNPRFPGQQLSVVYKPLLKDVVDTVDYYIEHKKFNSPAYNIEIKTDPSLDSVYTPAPEKFADLVVDFIRKEMAGKQVTIQSFDFRVLKYIHAQYPEVKLVALVENSKGVAANLSALGFVPEVYSPWYKLLSQESIELIHQKNMLVVPWTVNDTTAMQELIGWGVDGIITDYPNLAQKL